MNIKLSKHAEGRMKQRCVPMLILDWLIEYGMAEYDKHGAKVYYFTKTSLKRMRQEFGSLIVDKLNEFMRAYLVLSLDGTVITVGYRS